MSDERSSPGGLGGTPGVSTPGRAVVWAAVSTEGGTLGTVASVVDNCGGMGGTLAVEACEAAVIRDGAYAANPVPEEEGGKALPCGVGGAERLERVRRRVGPNRFARAETEVPSAARGVATRRGCFGAPCCS